MQKQHHNQETFPAKIPDPSMRNGAFSGWKHQHAHSENTPRDQVTQENHQSGHISVRALDNAAWLALKQHDSR
ncbi:hypothetical protein [Vampirovibrio sp.]|uniref:hypothetical protein n=1 Tax=Vampirovibrio sp. TaxID=2717857 RepID=UPI0035932580